MTSVENAPVSVIIPVKNGGGFIAEAIESVLAQTSSPSQLIVVDDGSTDETAFVVKSFGEKVEYFFQQHAGVSAALNLGLSHAQCDIVGFLDADDLWIPEKISLQMAAMEQKPDIDMIFGYMEEFHDGWSHEKEGDETPKRIPGYSKGTMLIKKTSLARVGFFESKWVVGEFIEWYTRAMEIGLKNILLPQVLLRRRIHGGNTMIREQKSTVDYARILKESLDRRRKNTPR